MGEVQANLFGMLAVKAGLATRAQVEECAHIQQAERWKGGSPKRLGEIMAEKGYLSQEQVEAILRGDFTEAGRRFGELCVLMRFCTQEQVDEAAAEQERLRVLGRPRRIGAVLVEQGHLQTHSMPAVLSSQGFEMAECTKCRVSYNVSVKAPAIALKCKRCGRDLIMIEGYEDLGSTDVAGDIRGSGIMQAVEPPGGGFVPADQLPEPAGGGVVVEEEISLDELMGRAAEDAVENVENVEEVEDAEEIVDAEEIAEEETAEAEGIEDAGPLPDALGEEIEEIPPEVAAREFPAAAPPAEEALEEIPPEVAAREVPVAGPPAGEGIEEIPPEVAAREVPAARGAVVEAPEEIPDDVEAPVYGDFRAIQKIGQDSLGVLYQAEHVKSGQVVTLKVIGVAHTRDKAFVNRFVAETKIAATLAHPNLKRVIAAGRARGHLYYASEFVAGKSVNQLIRSEKCLPVRAAGRIVRAVASGLRYAHSKGVYHGDIRPSNILVTPEGGVKLSDTGVAKNVRENIEHLIQVDGVTPFYMAPELATPRGVADSRSDVYELGATYFHMVTGRPPFEGNTPLQILMRMAQQAPPAADLVNVSVPAEVSRLIKKMMAPEFRDRYESIDEIIKELDRIESMASSGSMPAVLDYPEAEALPEGVPGKPVPVAKAGARRGKPKGRAGPKGSGIRRGVKGSGIRRGAKPEGREGGKEGRARPPAQKASSAVPLMIFVAFLAVAAVVIVVLVMKLKEKKPAGEGPTTTTAPAGGAAPAGSASDQPAGPETAKPAPGGETDPEQTPETEAAEGESDEPFGESLFRPDPGKLKER